MGIDGRFLRDLFTTLGDQRENGAWSMTVYVKPFVRWVWIGTIFIAFGGILAASDKRYRQFKVKQAQKLARMAGPVAVNKKSSPVMTSGMDAGGSGA
jgi:cytochrome c-type biogenesis protein CcmF